MTITIDVPVVDKKQEELLKDYLQNQALLFLEAINKIKIWKSEDILIDFWPEGIWKEEFEEYLQVTARDGKEMD